MVISKSAIRDFIDRPLRDSAKAKLFSSHALDGKLEALEPTPRLFTAPRGKHQKVCFLLGVQHDGYQFNLDMGLGKSWLVLNIFRHKRRLKRLLGVDKFRMLVLVPATSNLGQWRNECKAHVPMIPAVSVDAVGAAERMMQVRGDFDIVVLTYMGFLALVCRGKVVLDEDDKPKLDKEGNPVFKGWELDDKKLRAFRRLFDFFVGDECFVPGTLIDTPQGLRPIETIKEGDEVYNAAGVGKVEKVWTRPVKRIFEVSTSRGKICCSENHPFWVIDKGWIPAHALRAGDPLELRKDVSVLWQAPSSQGRGNNRELEEAEILQQEMLSAGAMGKGGAQGEGSGRTAEVVGFNPYGGEIRAWQKEKQDARSTGEGEVELDFACYEASANTKEGERVFVLSPKSFVGSFASGLDSGISNQVGDFVESNLPKGLQTRSSISFKEGSYRDRWGDPLQSEGTFEGYEKRSCAKSAWVESVEVIKQGDSREPVNCRKGGSYYLWDLQVSGSPTFYVSGILVHNSTSYKNPQTLLYRAVKKMAWGCENRYGLTGTPYSYGKKKRVEDLWAQFNVVDKGETLGETLGIFRGSFFTEKDNFWSGGKEYVFDERKWRALSRMLRHGSIRYTKEECTDLPPKVYTERPVTFDPETWAYYDRLVQQIRDSRGAFEVVDSAFIRMRQLTAGYLTMKDTEGGKQVIRFKRAPKIEAVIDWLKELPEDSKAILFHWYTMTGELLTEAMRKAKFKHVWLYSKARGKNELVDRFLTDPSVRFMVSSSAGAFGGNWQVANYVGMVESPTNSILRGQEEDRIYRIGQDKRCFIYDFYVAGSIDEKILDSLSDGQDLFKQLVDGTGPSLTRKRPRAMLL